MPMWKRRSGFISVNKNIELHEYDHISKGKTYFILCDVHYMEARKDNFISFLLKRPH